MIKMEPKEYERIKKYERILNFLKHKKYYTLEKNRIGTSNKLTNQMQQSLQFIT